MTEQAANNGLTILITTFNASSMIEETLSRLMTMEKVSGLDWEVLIVDNNSTDDTVEKARKFWDNQVELRIINEPQQGAGYSAFRGLKEAKYSWIGFVDQDNWLHSDWMIKAIKYIEEAENAAIVCGRGYPVFESEKPAWFDRYQANFAVGQQIKTNGKAENLNSFFYNAGSIMRKAAFEDVLKTGFQPLMKSRATNQLLAGDDTEMQIMFRLLGWEIHYQDELCFDHFMPRQRLSREYFRNMRMGMGTSSVYLGIYRNILKAKINGQKPIPIDWKKALQNAFRQTIHDPLAIFASLLPNFTSNHRIASYWSSLGEYRERRKLGKEFETVQNGIYAWMDRWLWQ